MIVCRSLFSALALALGLGWSACSVAQDTGKTQGEALDSLLEKLEKPGLGQQPARQPLRSKKDATPDRKPAEPAAKAKPGTDAKPTEPKPKPAGGQSAKPVDRAKTGSGDVSSQDKDLDALLEKLGETKDKPAPEERPRSHSQPGEPSGPSKPAPGGEGASGEKTKQKDQGLQGKDKEIDDKLEEFAGKKRKKKGGEQEEGSGPLGEIIKEMRDVEQRLGKPETGEDTQSKQKRIVKQIDTLIQQMKQSGSSSSMAMRRVRQQGQKPGDQPGQTPGANAAGAPPMKPAKPSDRHAPAGGKDIWGHLPEELRQEMENTFKEDALPAKAELIRRYYLSVAKQKLVRGD
ncbi:MAG TPA: hypothetical protein VN648_12480 [Candidatus Methylomirabilis sp.]|nr:hypothetical protein [Candidatus Methylomirabilis sp.]